MNEQMQMPPAEQLDIDAYLADVNSKIADKKVLEKISALQKENDFKKLSEQYAKLDKPLAVAYYAVKFAEQKNSVEEYVKAGDYNSLLIQTAPDDKARNYLSENRIACYEKAVALDSTKTENRIRLAGAYMEAGGPPMRGVSMLLDIVKTDSNNIDAQLMLARFDGISGQFEKAIPRYRKILYLAPLNEEALAGLEQAYEATGNIPKAIETLEQYKKILKDAESKRKVDEYIRQLKDSGKPQ